MINTVTCPKCNGKKRIVNGEFDSISYPCPKCNGRGFIYNRTEGIKRWFRRNMNPFHKHYWKTFDGKEPSIFFTRYYCRDCDIESNSGLLGGF